MRRLPHPAPSWRAWPFWLRHLSPREASLRSIRPGSGTGLPGKARAIATKAGDYELLLESDRHAFRLAGGKPASCCNGERRPEEPGAGMFCAR